MNRLTKVQSVRLDSILASRVETTGKSLGLKPSTFIRLCVVYYLDSLDLGKSKK